MTLLQNLPAGTTVSIKKIEGDASAVLRARELGLIPGTICTIVRKAPFGGPIQLAIGRGQLGIRPSDGLVISVEVVSIVTSLAV